MSSWLCYTRKMLASAIAVIAEELEQTAIDLNDAVQGIGMAKDDGQEQRLDCRYGFEPQSFQDTTTTQQPVTSSVLPSNVVPGDLVLENHFSSPNEPGPLERLDTDHQDIVLRHQQESPKSEMICRTADGHTESCTTSTASTTCRSLQFSEGHSRAQQEVNLGDKRPGKVIRTPNCDSCTFESEPVLESESGPRVNGLYETVNARDVDTQEKLASPSEPVKDLKSRWMGPFSRAMTFAYAQVTNTVFTMMEDASLLDDDEDRKDSRQKAPNIRICLTPPGRAHDSRAMMDLLRSQLTLEIPESSPYVDNCGHLSPVSIDSTYSTESFEIIEASVVDKHAANYDQLESTRPVFVVGEVQAESKALNISEDGKTASEMTTSSAEYVNFNFSNLISGRLFGVKSPVSDLGVTVPCVREGAVTKESCSDHHKCTRLDCALHVLSDDDDESFDILSEPSEEEFAMY